MNMYAYVPHVGCFKICMTHLGIMCMGMYATEPLPFVHFCLFLRLPTFSGFLSFTLTFDLTAHYLCTLQIGTVGGNNIATCNSMYRMH